MKKYLIIPLEVQNRELVPASELVIQALKKDWTIIIGQKQQIFPFIKNLPKSIWYLKSIVPGENTLIKKIKKSKHVITTLDIEGLINANIEDSLKQRYSNENIKLVEAIFFWGQNHYNLFKKTFKNFDESKIYITGSPVADQWLIDSEISKYKKNLRINSILVIPSFGFANSKTKDLNLRLAFDNIGLKSVKDSNKYSQSIFENLKKEEESQKAAYESFLKLIPKLCKKYPQNEIILRPHPMENIDLWTSKLDKFDNLIIDNSENKYDQILRSKAIIHFNSTMSIHSSLMKKKTILFNAIDKKYKEVINPINIKVSSYCESFDELIKIIDDEKLDYKTDFLKELLVKTEYDKYNNSSISIVKIFEKLSNKIPKNQLFNQEAFFNGPLSKWLYSYYQIVNSYIVPFLSYFTFIPYFKRFAHGSIYRDHKVSRKELMETKWKEISDIKVANIIKAKLKEENFKKEIKIEKHFSGMFFISTMNEN